MTVDNFPDRIITVDDTQYLYFGGTNYLGIATNPDFQTILFENIKKWGAAYGSSRNANVKLSIYETAEKLLAKNIGTESAVTVSSGMLAGKFVLEQLSKTTDAFFHFPETHPALMIASSLPIIVDGKLNSKIVLSAFSKITVVADAISSLEVEPIDLSILSQIPKTIAITLVIDESHSLGLIGENGVGILSIINIENIHKIIITASLGKALGISGGVIAGDTDFINAIKSDDTFIGASGMNPAYLETYINAQELYKSQKKQLQKNLNYINTHFINKAGFTFNPDYPVIYFDNKAFSKKLIENKIITTCFNYPTASGKLNRIVITANHTINDLDQLLKQLNADF